ncbi:MAG TPA: GNAT family N-acetyltransferase [Myxococcota bacterium]
MNKPIACGLCFPWALNDVLRHGGTLVHAVVTAPLSRPPHRYEHAWVERDGRVYDWQTMVVGYGGPRFAHKGYPIQTFYELYSPEHVVKYSVEEAVDESIVEGHDGPWDPEVARNAPDVRYVPLLPIWEQNKDNPWDELTPEDVFNVFVHGDDYTEELLADDPAATQDMASVNWWLDQFAQWPTGSDVPPEHNMFIDEQGEVVDGYHRMTAAMIRGYDVFPVIKSARPNDGDDYAIELVEIDTGGKHSFRFELHAVGRTEKPRSSPFAGTETVGMIEAFRAHRSGRVVYIVRNVGVDPELQRQGWGTLLYQAAAAEACRRRSTLASQGPRTEASQGFWNKQVSHDRATHLGRIERGHPDRSTYALRRELCPEPVLGNPTPGLELEARRDNPMFDLLLVARDRGELVGSLGLVRLEGDDLYGVIYGHVTEGRRREGIYGALVACAAEIACDEGMRVASDTSLSWDADAFWSSERGGGGRRESFDGRTRYVVPCEEDE